MRILYPANCVQKICASFLEFVPTQYEFRLEFCAASENYIRRYHGDMEANMVKSLKRYEYVIISDYLDTPLHFDPVAGKFPPRPKGVDLA